MTRNDWFFGTCSLYVLRNAHQLRGFVAVFMENICFGIKEGPKLWMCISALYRL